MDKLLTDHLDSIKKQHLQHGVPDDESRAILAKEVEAKRPYSEPNFGQVEVLVIVSALDDATVDLQEMGKSDFLDPLGWDILPSIQVLATVKSVLLLFELHCGNAQPSVVWSGLWAAWIVKNIDTHVSGWEWMASNEPIGLFTKPYDLSIAHLNEIGDLMKVAHTGNDEDYSWQRMPAYLCLRNWVSAVCKYLHMITHCLPTFPIYTYVAIVTKPPKRTPKQNTWFLGYTDEGVPYYYNRHLQQLMLDKPDDFDGENVVVPRTIEDQMKELLIGDPILRAEVEVRRVQMDIEKDKENEWVECFDETTRERFYYSFQRFKISYTRPQSKNIITSANSPAYRGVLRIQAAYRMKQAKQFVEHKRKKTRKLPKFNSRNFF